VQQRGEILGMGGHPEATVDEGLDHWGIPASRGIAHGLGACLDANYQLTALGFV